MCAAHVTNEPITLDVLRYWSVDLQEAYRGPAGDGAGNRCTGKSREGMAGYLRCRWLRAAAEAPAQPEAPTTVEHPIEGCRRQ